MIIILIQKNISYDNDNNNNHNENNNNNKDGHTLKALVRKNY